MNRALRRNRDRGLRTNGVEDPDAGFESTTDRVELDSRQQEPKMDRIFATSPGRDPPK